jgi:hypothetical protein
MPNNLDAIFFKLFFYYFKTLQADSVENLGFRIVNDAPSSQAVYVIENIDVGVFGAPLGINMKSWSSTDLIATMMLGLS